MTNTNVLQGMKCPGCGAEGPFDIEGISIFKEVTDEGTAEYGDVRFPSLAYIVCCACRRDGTYAEFQGKDSWKCKNCGANGELNQLLLNRDWDNHCPDCCSAEIALLPQ